MGGDAGRRRVLFVGRRGDLGVRARGWKAGAIVAGDLGFGCARKTTLQLGPGCQWVLAWARYCG